MTKQISIQDTVMRARAIANWSSNEAKRRESETFLAIVALPDVAHPDWREQVQSLTENISATASDVVLTELQRYVKQSNFVSNILSGDDNASSESEN